MKHSIESFRACKAPAQPLVCLTAYTAPMARILDRHCDLLLVGDSLGMVVYGMDSTQGVTLEMMIAHGKAVTSSTENALVVVDLPYGTYEEGPETALNNARRVMTGTGCAAVKLEGGARMAGTIAALAAAGIPVMGHIGLLPQTAPDEGGYRVRGRDDKEAAQILEDARAVEKAGAFSLVIEAVYPDIARAVSEAVSIPVIGIGAAAECDGQILVTDDMLGLVGGKSPKFVRHYGDLAAAVGEAAAAYAADVRGRTFPGPAELYIRKASTQKTGT